MKHDIVFVEKAEIDRAGTTLAEIKTMRAQGDLSEGPTGKVEILRYATKPCPANVDAMDKEAIVGINNQ